MSASVIGLEAARAARAKLKPGHGEHHDVPEQRVWAALEVVAAALLDSIVADLQKEQQDGQQRRR